jgi:hypothetical protein
MKRRAAAAAADAASVGRQFGELRSDYKNSASSLSTAAVVGSVHWYVVCGLVAVCLVAVGGLTVCVYRCYRRRGRHFDGPRSPSGVAGRLKRDRLSGGGSAGLGSAGTVLVPKSPSLSPGSGGGTIHSRTQPVSKLGHGPTGTGRDGQQLTDGSTAGGGGHQGIVCESQVVQTQCYIVNDRAQTPVRSPEADEKRETTSEKSSKDIEADDVTSGQLGSLQFSVGYDADRSTLTVSVISAKHLPVKNVNIASSDPYVKLQLLPDKRQKVKTRVLRKTLNPVFDETFTFYGVDENQLVGITLHFVVLSFDRFSRDDVVGEVVYQLDELSAAADTGSNKKLPAVVVSREIIPRQIRMSGYSRGELLVSLCHHPAANRLTVVILKARNLPKMDITGLADPYVKVYLTYNGQRISKKKTHVKKRTLNPVFNESFIFDLPPPPQQSAASSPSDTSPTGSGGVGVGGGCGGTGLTGVSLEMVVLDWDQMTKNELIGRVEIGSGGRSEHRDRGETECRHWTEVISCPRKQIASWHKLKE